MDSFDTYSPFCYAVSHDECSEKCWCRPDVEEMEDGVLLVTHYEGVC